MSKPFIRNHQYNLIQRQAGIIQHALKTTADLNVMEVAKYSALSKVLDAISHTTDSQDKMLRKMIDLETAEEFQQYINSLEPLLLEFPQVTKKQLTKLFSKNKKLKLPDLASIDFQFLTYLGWLDISKNKLFIVYELDNELMGIEGNFTITNKKNICSLCKGFSKVVFVSAISKTKPKNTSPDYYKSYGNYMCMNSEECNQNITDVSNLESFIRNVRG
ncbi:FusB/FusC family EF-G-binding protein [Cytobacillus sp. Hm23]